MLGRILQRKDIIRHIVIELAIPASLARAFVERFHASLFQLSGRSKHFTRKNVIISIAV
ncbi:hypothetical protein GCM10022278_15300 [Allohahella marinimesophila]|uniref:Uncharacterized protein n=1 Tax=Allohahella marinimesophila TaxID=1054972 RepID=A0ABP7P0X5_9GAMM